MVETVVEEKLKFIDFLTLDKWFVSYYINPHSIKSKYPLTSLKYLIKPVKEKIRLKEYKGDLRVVKKISFNDGQIHIREENETKMDLYTLYPNDLLVSKINFHQGALALNSFEKIVCTTHYQPYSINREKVFDEYLITALRGKSFQNHLDFLRAEGIKNEATYEFIGELEIPLPSLPEQEKIINSYNGKIEEAKALQLETDKLKDKIESYLLEELGIKITREKKGDTFISKVSFEDIERWSVDFIKQSIDANFVFKGKYQPVRLKQIIEGYQYGLSEKASKENIGIPMLRMNNIYNSELVTDDLKYITKTKEVSRFILNKGELLFNRTNSKELVGKTAVFDKEEEYTFASYLIRVVINNKIADSDFINYLFNSSILKIQKDLVSRQITGQANINAQEMKEFLFPLPPLKRQKEIVESIKDIKSQIFKNEQHAEQLVKMAEMEFENNVFK